MGIEEWVAKLDSMTPEEKLATIKLTSVKFYKGAMVLEWSGIIGFGEYTIATGENGLSGNSEGLDLHNEEKKFLRHLLNQLVERVSLAEEKRRDDEWRERQEKK